MVNIKGKFIYLFDFELPKTHIFLFIYFPKTFKYRNMIFWWCKKCWSTWIAIIGEQQPSFFFVRQTEELLFKISTCTEKKNSKNTWIVDWFRNNYIDIYIHKNKHSTYNIGSFSPFLCFIFRFKIYFKQVF
jgi:hypothetical protein